MYYGEYCCLQQRQRRRRRFVGLAHGNVVVGVVLLLSLAVFRTTHSLEIAVASKFSSKRRREHRSRNEALLPIYRRRRIKSSQPTGDSILQLRRLSHSPSSSSSSLSSLSPSSSSSSLSSSSWTETIRVGLAGGIAGAIGTLALYPFDSAKTLRQSNPSRYTSVRHALLELCRPLSCTSSTTSISAMPVSTPPLPTPCCSEKQLLIGCASRYSSHDVVSIASSSMSTASSCLPWRQRAPFIRAYNGLWTSTLGAIPSSALYFGAYESMKRLLIRRFHNLPNNDAHLNDAFSSSSSLWLSRRLTIHGAAAFCGNVISSAVFVPKEVVKQQMQFEGLSLRRTVWKVLSEKGFIGLYCGYKATLMRNIPSAMLRFVIYEELKRAWQQQDEDEDDDINSNTSTFKNLPCQNHHHHHHHHSVPNRFLSWKLFMAGALAGAIASGMMTPIDVLKTRLATGTCPVDVSGCLQHVIQEQGFWGLYTGAGSRMAFSGAYSAIGFASFEAAKTWLGVSDPPQTFKKK